MTGETTSPEVPNIAVIMGQHADKVMVLAQLGFFNMVSGSFTVHFNAEGKMKKIERNYTNNLS